MAQFELATRHELSVRAKRKKRRHWIELISVLALLTLWFFTYAPVQLGGPVTYAVVTGHSMEPMLHTGDLVLVRSATDYHSGDVVLTSVMGGYVIHKVVDNNGTIVHTRGINNDFADTWDIPIANVVGRYQMQFSGFGNVLVYLRSNPLQLGLGAALLAALMLVDPRRRRISKRLKALLIAANREFPRQRRDALTPLLTGAFVLSAISVLATGILLADHAYFYPRVALTLLGVLVSVVAFELIGNWLNAGTDLEEPYRSFHVFRKRLYRLTADVEIPGHTVAVASATELEAFAEIANCPVVHIEENNGLEHRFFVVTDQLNYCWTVRLDSPNTENHMVGRHRLVRK